MDYDTIIYAVIAVVLLARLWVVFGRRSDDDPQRPNPFILPAPVSEEPGNAGLTKSQTKLPIMLAPTSVAGGLEQIKTLIPSFDERAFLQEARVTFTTIVTHFAKGDMGDITSLLGPHVLPHFQNAIDARQQAGQTMENRILRITDAETVTAIIDGTLAVITVRFTSQQENVIRNARREIVGGTDGKVEEIKDLWTFTQDMSEAEPKWVLTETRS